MAAHSDNLGKDVINQLVVVPSKASANSSVSTTTTIRTTVVPSAQQTYSGTTSISSTAAESAERVYVGGDEPRSGPYVDTTSSKNVTALLGKTAYLNCRVKNLGNKTVSPSCLF